MQRRTTLALLATTASLWLAAATPAVAQTRELNFGFISTESSSNLKTAWQPVLDDLQKATGLKVNAFFAPDYAGVIEAMRFGKVQVAWMGNKSAMEAVDRAQGEVFAKAINADGSQGYWSLMLVHRDSPMKTLDDVLKARGELTLGMGDINSTSGTLVPGYYAFAQSKVDAGKEFKRAVRSNHETNILAVANKQVDVATVASDTFERLKARSPEKVAELREVWRSPLIASDPLLWRKDLDVDIKKKLRDFLLAYGRQDAREKEVMKVLTWAGFTASDNSQLVPIRQLALAGERAKIEADAALSADDRTKRLADIDARLAELGKQLATAK